MPLFDPPPDQARGDALVPCRYYAAPAASATAHGAPRRDPDGNAIGGVRLPDMEAPLGVHGGQNQPLTFTCMLVGSYLPFAKTAEERAVAHDNRLSVAERYRDRSDYVNRIRGAARTLEMQGFLLPEDASIIVNAAAQAPDFK